MIVLVTVIGVTTVAVPVTVMTVAGRETGHVVGVSSPGRAGRSSSSAA
jgi:hypothetical protein